MKNLTFKAAMLKGSQPTVNRRSTDGQSQRHCKQTPLSKRWKVLMTLVFLFTFAIGNVLGADDVYYVMLYNNITDAGVLTSSSTLNYGIVKYSASTGKYASSTEITVEGMGTSKASKYSQANISTFSTVGNWAAGSGTAYAAGGKFTALTIKLGTKTASSIKFIGYRNTSSTGEMTISETAKATAKKPSTYGNDCLLEWTGNFTGDVSVSVKDNKEHVGVFIITVTAGGGTDVCPSGLSISGTKNYTEGQKIELTAALTAGNGSITYQWYKGGTAEANKLTGKTAAKLEIASCTGSDAGDYYCKASKSDCSDAVNAEAYTVTVATIQPTGTATISYALSGSTTSGTVTGVNSISGLSSSLTLSTLTLSGTKDGYSGGIKGCTGTDLVETDYVDVQFTVGSGYVFTPSAVTVQANPLGNTGALKAVVKVMDAQPLEVASEELSCAKNTDNAVTFASGAFTNKKFEGTVHLRMYFYGAASDKTFYLKSPISITGTVAVAPTKYNVTFDKNDEGAGGSQTTLKYEAGAEVTLPACTFDAPTGKEFDAWTSTDVTILDGKFTMPSNAVTIKATWKTSSTKYTVTYKEGETTLDTEDVVAGTAPTGYSALESKSLASFVAWYNNADLAEEHKIADMSAETVSEATTYYGKWTYNYASSVNIEAWELENGAGKGATTKTSALISLLGINKFASNLVWENGNIELDSLDDAKGDRNEPYLGLKVKSGGKMIDFRVANGQTVKVKFGAIKSTKPQVKINGVGSYADMTITDKVWSYTATGNDYISIKMADNNAVVFKQIMIGADPAIADVTLPWKVTYDAGTGTCGTTEAIWSGSALILPAVTAPTDYTFAGWYDEATGGVLVGDAGASYNATDNVTLYAHYAPVEYAVNYSGGEGATGTMTAGAAGWGTMVTPDANAFEKTGHVFSGWEITKTSDGSATGITFSEGKFEMPKYDVTLVAQWEDNSKVAKIDDNKYESLEEALLHAADGTIELLQNINVTAQVEIFAGVTATIDLAGYKIEYTGTSTLPSGVILVHNGASLTIDDSSDPDAGSIVSGEKAYAAIALTKAGDDAANPAVLEINGGTFTGDYYAITGNGARHNTQITINAGTFSGAHANDNSAIYHPQQGTLIINGGTFTGYSAAIELRAGTLEINGGTFTATAPAFSCNPNGSGTTTVGAAIAIAQHTTKVDIAVTINGGEFNGVKAVNESNPQVNDPAPQVDLAVTGGDFTGEVSTVDVDHFISGGSFDAPVTNENCAYGYVPAPEVAPGVYTVMPKDGVSLVKIVPTSQTKGTQTGLYPDGDELTINLSSGMNLGGSGKYIGVKATENFQEGDVLHLNMSTYQNNQNATAYVYADKDASVFLFDTEEKCDENKDYYITMPAAVNGHNELYIVRTEGNKWNGGPSVMEVTRVVYPTLTAITIDGRNGVINEAAKTVAVQIPYEADLAALTVVPTIVWNEAAATNSIVVNDGSAWIEGANTYKLTDKDGDYTVYTITLTRDVQKHAVKFYDGETLLETLEVEDGTSIAAGDVPADPEKEDYLFQGWAETVDGAAVDVTSFTISAAKNFYAKWAADGAIKLINKTSGAVNEDGYFITGVTATEANSEKAAAWGGTQGTSISGVNALGKIVQYNATTNQTKIKIKVYNTNSSDKYVYIHKIIEGKTTEESVETLTATSKTVVESEFYEFNDTKNRSFYLTTNSTDVKILQVKVIDDGATPMKQAGEAGYSLNLNKGRVVYYANADVAFEGLALNSASNYSVISSSEFQTTKNFSFSISTPVLLKVTTNTAKYYVSQDPDEDGTTATAVTDAGTAEFNLTTTGTWYLVPSTTSNVKYTNIAFELPKAATPVIETQPATNHTFNPGDMTATVVATVSEGTLHYQWYKKATVGDDEEVGTDAATLTTTTEGTYYVVVTNVLAGHQNTSVTSDEAELGYRVTNDATLMALSYGTPATAIALEDGVYTYNVELAKGTTDVPALAATATMDGYADVDINDAAEFVNYEASSTVTVKSEDLTETNVYTVNFYVKHDLPQVDVTASTVWDMNNVSASEINLASMTPSKQNVLLLLANIEGVNNNASFNSQALMFEGQRIGRTENNVKYVSGQYVQFNVTVPGMVSVTFASNGSAQRTILINGKQCSRTTNDGTYIKYDVAVEPGSVEIEDVQGYVRISKIEFKAEYSHNRPGLNPANIGTLCWTNNAILGGATLYELAGKNENNKLVFDEVAENRLEAGKPYIFVPENGNTEIKLYNTDTEAALTQGDLQAVNGMHGTFVNLSSADGDLLGNYVISKNHYIYVDSDNVTLKAYRAYITSLDDVEPVNNGPAPINGAPRRRIVMGAQGEQVATGIDNLEASEKPLKLMIDGQMYILRGEKLFDATGRLVK